MCSHACAARHSANKPNNANKAAAPRLMSRGDNRSRIFLPSQMASAALVMSAAQAPIATGMAASSVARPAVASWVLSPSSAKKIMLNAAITAPFWPLVAVSSSSASACKDCQANQKNSAATMAESRYAGTSWVSNLPTVTASTLRTAKASETPIKTFRAG